MTHSLCLRSLRCVEFEKHLSAQEYFTVGIGELAVSTFGPCEQVAHTKVRMRPWDVGVHRWPRRCKIVE